MDDAETAVRVRIAGHVQGVGFRAWTLREARALGLRGWVRNRPDGSVAAMISGPPEAVAAMLRRFREGPPGARVAAIETAGSEPEEIRPSFDIEG